MSTVTFDKLSEVEVSQLACTLSALILQDEKSDVTSENLLKIIKASGLKVPEYWPTLFAKALEGKDLTTLLTSGSGSKSNAPAAKEEKAEAKKEEVVVEEEEVDMNLDDMFG